MASNGFDDKIASGQQFEVGHEERKHSVVDSIGLRENLSAKISNPLADIPYDQLMIDVELFCEEKGFEDKVDLMKRGALVAQDQVNFEAVEALDDDELEALRNEQAHRWSHPAKMYFTIIICSIGAAVQGWDQTGSNGANLSFPVYFGIGDAGNPQAPKQKQIRDQWLVGLINAAPYIGSAFLGVWMSDPLNNYLGRRGVIFISAVFCLLTPIGGAFAQSWKDLLATRLLLGVGMGLKASTVPIFAAENAPARIRGALVMSWQMWTAFGIVLGFAANLVVAGTGKIAWRLQFGSAMIPAIPLVVGIFFCPESPRWLMKKNRYTDAYRSLRLLRFNDIQAARDLYYIHTLLELEASIVGNSTYITRFIQLFTIPRVRRATLASFVVMIAQQMCGINIISFYSSTIFADAAGASDRVALIASLGFGLVNWAFAWPAIWTIDTFGRRSLLLFTFPNMAWTLLAAGFSLWIKDPTTKLGVVAFFIYIFAAFYSPGEGPVPFTYSAEVFPLSHREVGMAWAVATCLFWAAVLSISFPAIYSAFTPVGAVGFYAGLNVVAFVMIFFFVPETKQRTLEELDYIFAVPSSKFRSYQVNKAAPYFVKRYLLFNKSATLEPLYEMDKSLAGDKHD